MLRDASVIDQAILRLVFLTGYKRMAPISIRSGVEKNVMLSGYRSMWIRSSAVEEDAGLLRPV